MTPRAPVRALIFDFDGVLADTEDLHCAAFQDTAAHAGLAFSRRAYYECFLGLPDRACLAAMYERQGMTPTAAQLDALVAYKRQQFAARAQTAGLYPGVADALRRLQQHFILAVASGAFGDEIAAILERAGVLQWFAALVGAEHVRAGKPAPDPFLEALRAIERNAHTTLSPAECLVIEDSPRGIAAAHAAGMRCVAVTTNHDRAALATADVIIEGVSALRPEDLQ
jgi:beta-phosphoglucomutase